MENFKAILSSINNQSGIIHIYHKLFGGKRYHCEKIHIICDEHRMGVIINGHDIFIPTNEVVAFEHTKNKFIIQSDKQQIKIFLKNFQKNTK